MLLLFKPMCFPASSNVRHSICFKAREISEREFITYSKAPKLLGQSQSTQNVLQKGDERGIIQDI